MCFTSTKLVHLLCLDLVKVTGFQQILSELAFPAVLRVLYVAVSPLSDRVVIRRLWLVNAKLAHVILEILHESKSGILLSVCQ